MLTFNFPTLTKAPFELELNDFVPAPELDGDLSCVSFKFGRAILELNMIKEGVVNLISKRSNGKNETVEGTCTPETAEALEKLYWSNT